MAKIENIIYDLAYPIVEENGLELVDVEFVKEGSEWFLRVFIDKENDEGINLDDCEKVSRILSTKLDEKDPITQAYHLEVSSPGIERPLKKTKDFIKFTGHTVQINTFVPIDGQKQFVGKLEQTNETEINILTEKGLTTIPREKVAKANLVWEG